MGAQAVRLSNVDINNALENKDFEVLFQPIFDLSNGALARMETFVRWRHPSLGVLPPGAFISFFESQGRMGELTRYILDEALNSYAEWRGPYAPGFSINLSLADLADETFTSHLTTAMQARDFPADLITLECPMPPVDSDLEGMVDRFSGLRKTGARLAIEVRGRASEFLRTVDPFPFDEIKTGGSSILRFARTVRGPGLSAISDLLDIAKKANAVTTAVGVEDQASLSALRGLGFTAAQGNHLAKVGVLNDFRPARVNHVRELLELPTLNGDELAALFRTTAPAPQAAGSEDATEKADVDPGAANPDKQDAVENTEAAETSPTEEDKQALVARARKKAKAIALAKRAKARDARKAAAIKRAKAKVALAKQQSEQDADLASDASKAPRDLQDRIAQEFADAPGENDAPAETVVDVVAAFVEDASEAPSEGSDSHMTDKEPDDAPSTTEAATISGSGEPAPEPPENDSFQVQIPISNARVYFRPGISVRSAPTTISGGLFAPAPSHDAQSRDAAVDVAFADDGDDVADPRPAEAAPVAAEQNDFAMSETASDPAPVPSNEDAVTETYDDLNAQPPQRPKRKHFLARRYKVVPKHFWPKPWKRAIQQRRSANENAAEA